MLSLFLAVLLFGQLIDRWEHSWRFRIIGGRMGTLAGRRNGRGWRLVILRQVLCRIVHGGMEQLLLAVSSFSRV